MFGYVCNNIGLKEKITINSDISVYAVELDDDGKEEFNFNSIDTNAKPHSVGNFIF